MEIKLICRSISEEKVLAIKTRKHSSKAFSRNCSRSIFLPDKQQRANCFPSSGGGEEEKRDVLSLWRNVDRPLRKARRQVTDLMGLFGV